MSKLVEVIKGKTKEELAGLGKVSSRIRTSGMHLVTIKEAQEIEADTYSMLMVTFENKEGETVIWRDFMGTPKDDSQESIDKANAKTDRVLSALARLVKATGINNIADITNQVSTTTDDKDRTITTFNK